MRLTVFGIQTDTPAQDASALPRVIPDEADHHRL
jgi:hypothetical protein